MMTQTRRGGGFITSTRWMSAHAFSGQAPHSSHSKAVNSPQKHHQIKTGEHPQIIRSTLHGMPLVKDNPLRHSAEIPIEVLGLLLCQWGTDQASDSLLVCSLAWNISSCT